MKVSRKRLETSIRVFGGYSVGVTPVPIPNTEVKSYSADDTAWETVWESRSPPKLFENPVLSKTGFLFAVIFVRSSLWKKLKKTVDGVRAIVYNCAPLPMGPGC